MKKEVDIIYAQIRERYLKIVWTHVYQECEADIKKVMAKMLKVAKITLSSISSAGIISILFTKIGSEFWLELTTALCSVILTIITFLCENDKLESSAHTSMKLASECHDLRNKYESLLADIRCRDIGVDNIRSRREQLEMLERDLYKNEFPRVSVWAKIKAQRQLTKNSRNRSTPEERDAIMPDSLQDDIK